MISVGFQGQPFNITVIQVYASTTDAKEAEVDQLYEDLEDILELTPEKRKRKKKRCPIFIGYWNTKVGTQEIPGVTDKFFLGS